MEKVERREEEEGNVVSNSVDEQRETHFDLIHFTSKRDIRKEKEWKKETEKCDKE